MTVGLAFASGSELQTAGKDAGGCVRRGRVQARDPMQGLEFFARELGFEQPLELQGCEARFPLSRGAGPEVPK